MVSKNYNTTIRKTRKMNMLTTEKNGKFTAQKLIETIFSP